MKRPGHVFTKSSLRRAQDIHELELRDKTSKSLLANVLDMDDDSLQRFDSQRYDNSFIKLNQMTDDSNFKYQQQQSKIVSTKQTYSSQSEMMQILREIRYITDRMRKEDEDTEIINDWKYVLW